MAYPNTPGERRTFVGGWQPANDAHGAAHLWKIDAEGKATRFEADYYQSGKIIANFKGASIASVIVQIQARFGPEKK